MFVGTETVERLVEMAAYTEKIFSPYGSESTSASTGILSVSLTFFKNIRVATSGWPLPCCSSHTRTAGAEEAAVTPEQQVQRRQQKKLQRSDERPRGCSRVRVLESTSYREAEGEGTSEGAAQQSAERAAIDAAGTVMTIQG